jgi:hypothetical protein
MTANYGVVVLDGASEINLDIIDKEISNASGKCDGVKASFWDHIHILHSPNL